MWLNENLGKGVITFDFDSTMTTPVWDAQNEGWGQGDPTNLDHHHFENIDLMKKYAAQGYTIYIVTTRSLSEVPEVESFVAHHKLPVAQYLNPFFVKISSTDFICSIIFFTSTKAATGASTLFDFFNIELFHSII